MSPSPTPIRFHVYRGDQLLRSETIAELIIKIGQVASSHLRIEDDAASRHHAMIEVASPAEIYVVDLGSRTGTYVNGERADKARLHDGDEIRIGETRLLVELSPADAASGASMPSLQPPAAAAAARASIESGMGSTPVPLGAREAHVVVPPSHVGRRWAITGAILVLLIVTIVLLAMRR